MRFGSDSVADVFRHQGLDARANEPLSVRTSMRIGGAADVWVSVRSAGDLSALARKVWRLVTPHAT